MPLGDRNREQRTRHGQSMSRASGITAACLPAFAFALLAQTAAAFPCDSLASMKWLLGEWHAEDGKSTWHESWTAAGAGTWEGRGVETAKADPSQASAEDLRLVEMGGGVFYVAKVAHNELPVAFRLVECDATHLAFANRTHDFPRRLDYTRQGDDRLQVRVSDGGEKGFTLDFARVGGSQAAESKVLQAEDARFAAMVGADREAMRRWFADDLAYVHSTGAVEDREQLIEGIVSGRLRYLAIAPSDRRVVFAGPEAAIVQGLAHIEVLSGDRTLEFTARYLAVYGLREGTWRLRAWQSLRLP
jgi:hypothetical protein